MEADRKDFKTLTALLITRKKQSELFCLFVFVNYELKKWKIEKQNNELFVFIISTKVCPFLAGSCYINQM